MLSASCIFRLPSITGAGLHLKTSGWRSSRALRPALNPRTAYRCLPYQKRSFVATHAASKTIPISRRTNEAYEHEFEPVELESDGSLPWSKSPLPSLRPPPFPKTSGLGLAETHLESRVEPLGPPMGQKLRTLAQKLPPVHSRVIRGQPGKFRPQKLTTEEVSTLGEIFEALDLIVTRNASLGARESLDLLRIVQAFPDQLCQWAILHLVEPRSRAVQLWALSVLHALARLQHPLTSELWRVVKESDIQIPVPTYIELCHYFGLPPETTDFSRKLGPHQRLSRAEKAAALQSVLHHAKQTGNAVIILTCWNHTIQGLLAQSDVLGAEREWDALLRMGHTPPIELLQAFIKFYSAHVKTHPQYVEKVAAFHSRIKLLNKSPDLHTYSAIMKCYERSMRYKEMDSVLLEMTQEELKLQQKQQQQQQAQPEQLHGFVSSTGIKVRGPRATQLRESDSESLHDWNHLSFTHDHTPPSIRPPLPTPEWEIAPHDLVSPTSVPMDANSTLPSPSSDSGRIMPSEPGYSTTDDKGTSQSPDNASFDISAAKIARLSNAQNSSLNASELKIGHLVYTGGAQWAGSGRKQPMKSSIIRDVQSALISPQPPPLSALPNSVNMADENCGRKSHPPKRQDLLAERRLSLVGAWSRAIYSALSLGSLRKAMFLVEEMETLGLEVNDRICTEFMFFAGKRGNSSLLDAWWNRLTSLSNSPLRRKHYLIYMRELLRLDKAKEARVVMSTLCNQFGHFDDAYALWLRYYSTKGLNTSIERTLKQMEINKVEYGLYSTAALMEVFAKRGNVDELFNWLARFKVKASTYAIDEVFAKCVFLFMTEKHPLKHPNSWLDALPEPPSSYPRTLAALMLTLGSQKRLPALDELASLCSQLRDPHILVGFVGGYSLTNPSPKRNHEVVEMMKNCGNLKFQLSASQNEDILKALVRLEMPALLLEWEESLINSSAHVVEPSTFVFGSVAQASLKVGKPEAFVDFASKSFDKCGTLPPMSIVASVVRAICTTKDVDRILYIATPLASLYSHNPTPILAVLDDELTRIGVTRPLNVPQPRSLANPSTLDIPAYISRRLNRTS